MLENITANLNWKYPFQKAAAVRAKETVSSILHADRQFAQPDYNFSFEPFEKNADKTDSLVLGSAVHLVIKNIDLPGDVGKDRVSRTITDLLEKGYITEQVAAKIDIQAVLRFFNGDLGLLIKDSRNTVEREWPFTYAAKISDLYPDISDCGGEKIIVQGIADMLIRTPDGIIIIDFKTDRISDGQIEQRSARYTPQLKWYCRAAKEILNAKSASGYLYFISAGRGVKVV
jgi:ATP-dependent helicase/nuclease subunit A